MAWTWGPSNWLWQVVYTGSRFNPLHILNPASAKSWYAEHSAANWQAGNFGGKALAIIQDAVGGYVSSWTGSPASTAQAWWSAGWSVPTFFVGGAWGKAISYTSAMRGSFAGWCTATDALTGGAPVDPVSGAFQVIGLSGNFAGQLANRIPQMTFVTPRGQLQWGFGSARAMQVARTLEDASKGVSSFTYGTNIGQTIGRTIPNVGGIFFENCSAELTEVGEIMGAYWDAHTGSIVLLGRQGKQSRSIPLALPKMDRDHMVVSLRAYLAGQPIGVSIDPPSEYRDGIRRGVSPPDGTPMLVSYLGNTDGTLFGAIMFEADRLLKNLGKGVHNETREQVRATVPGFKPLLEMIKPSDGRPTNVWHRFWFVIDKVELKHDEGADAIVFGDVRLKVLTETEMDGRSTGKYIDPADETFARHLTEHYDEYAKDFPILAKLKELAKVAAIAKFLVNRGMPVDLRALFMSPSARVDTPSTTPGISVTSPNIEMYQKGNVVHTHTVSLFGGVDMEVDPQILTDVDGEVYQLRHTAESARPSGSSSTWTFRENGAIKKALAVKVGRAKTPFQRVCDDHIFSSVSNGWPLSIRRTYDSSIRLNGGFGPGWSLCVPFSITILPASCKRDEALSRQEISERSVFPLLILHDHTLRESSMYRSTDTPAPRYSAMFCKVTSQTVSREQVSFQYDPSDCIRAEGTSFVLDRSGFHYCFDKHGQLQEVRKDNFCLARYHRENQRIVRIVNGLHRAYDIQYEHLEQPRIVEITPSDGPNIRYLYDSLGYLVSCRINGQYDESYSYDLQGRLTEIRDYSGQVSCRIVYNDFGEVVKDSSDVVTDSSGGKVFRLFERGMVVSAKDEAGNTLHLKYGDQGELSMVQIGDRAGRVRQLAYDLNGKLISFRDSLGGTLYLHYDQFGRVIRCTGPAGRSKFFQLDEKGRVVGVTDQKCHWTAEYDDAGNLRSVIGPGEDRWSYEYAGEFLLGIRGPTREVRVKPWREKLEIQTSVLGHLQQKLMYDRNQQLKRYQTRGTKPVRFHYDELGNLQMIHNEAGTTHYRLNEKDLTLTIAFQTN